MDDDKDADTVNVIDDVIENVDRLSVSTGEIDEDRETSCNSGKDEEPSSANVNGWDEMFKTSNDVSDLRLVVQGKPLYVSRIVLSLVSPVLKSLFSSRRADDTVEIEIPGKKYEDIVQFLACIYPNILAPVTADNVEPLLILADEFEVGNLMRKCEDFLVKNIKQSKPKPNPEQIVHYLKISDEYCLENLQRAAFETAAKTESELLENVEEFWDLPSVTTTSVFIRRLKLLEKCGKNIRNKVKELQNHCSLYHKDGRREGNCDNMCTKCYSNIGKYTIAELKHVH